MIEISADGMRFTGGASQGLTPWSAIVAIEEGTKAAYFFVNSLSAHIVPRRACADVASFDHFLAPRARASRPAVRLGKRPTTRTSSPNLRAARYEAHPRRRDEVMTARVFQHEPTLINSASISERLALFPCSWTTLSSC
jgi:hypothetical protein